MFLPLSHFPFQPGKTGILQTGKWDFYRTIGIDNR